MQGNHLDWVQLLRNDNEHTKTNSSLILVKSQIADVLTKGISLTKNQDNNPDESNALLKELRYGYINIKKKEFVVIDVKMENDNGYVRKRKTSKDAQVSVTEVPFPSLS